MPVTTPSIKVDAVKALDGDVILFGDTYDDAYAHARALEKEHGYVFIHPFDDPEVIAGQGTIGMEILDQIDGNIDALFVPVGGGGLIAGIASYVKAVQPDVRIIGVEPADSSAMRDSIAAGKPVVIDHVGIFAVGVAVRRVGDETFRLCQQHVDEFITVDPDQICAAIRDNFEDTRSIVEPAGGLSVAALKKYVADNNISGQTLVTINCAAHRRACCGGRTH
jgi:threonine dehydratase